MGLGGKVGTTKNTVSRIGFPMQSPGLMKRGPYLTSQSLTFKAVPRTAEWKPCFICRSPRFFLTSPCIKFSIYWLPTLDLPQPAR